MKWGRLSLKIYSNWFIVLAHLLWIIYKGDVKQLKFILPNIWLSYHFFFSSNLFSFVPPHWWYIWNSPWMLIITIIQSIYHHSIDDSKLLFKKFFVPFHSAVLMLINGMLLNQIRFFSCQIIICSMTCSYEFWCV